jgi:hypothetical protein
MFKRVKNNFKKAEAAVIVQNLLVEHKEAGNLNRDPAEVANALISAVWGQKPDLFEGRFGTRPHKIAVAASALANALEISYDWGQDRRALIGSFLTVMAEVQTNGGFYGLSGPDNVLLEYANGILARVTEEVEADPLYQEVKQRMFLPG